MKIEPACNQWNPYFQQNCFHLPRQPSLGTQPNRRHRNGVWHPLVSLSPREGSLTWQRLDSASSNPFKRLMWCSGFELELTNQIRFQSWYGSKKLCFSEPPSKTEQNKKKKQNKQLAQGCLHRDSQSESRVSLELFSSRGRRSGTELVDKSLHNPLANFSASHWSREHVSVRVIRLYFGHNQYQGNAWPTKTRAQRK